MPSLPRITIVTPSFNQGKYLNETITSILNQEYPNLEYMVIDGGSTDESVDIIRSHADHLTYWCSQKDAGQTDAIMKGFKRCSGVLFAWVNSDDVLFPGCLQAAADCYQAHNAPDIIHTNIAYIDSQSRISRFIRVPQQSRFFFFRGVWHASAPSIFFKTALFRNVGGLDKTYHLSMDVDIWVRMLKAGAKVAHIPCYLGGFRWHDCAKTVQSLKTRSTQENHETKRIFNSQLAGSSPAQRAFWRKIYKIYQLINLNYLRAYKDLKSLQQSRLWHEAVNTAAMPEKFKPDCTAL
jgi:glycosyltransferase involved in cell wall biosynthesis